MAIRRDEVFVLKRIPFRETSLIVTVFGREEGKIKVLVKGVRKEKNPLTAHYEPFTHLTLVYYEKLKSDIHLGSETVVINSNSFLRERLDRFSYASYMTELVDVLFGAHDPHSDVFDLLASGFRSFQNAPPNRVARIFEFKLFEKAGLLPMLTHCASCGTEGFGDAFFSTRQGGIICRKCDHGEIGAIPISKGAIQSLSFFLKSNIGQAISLRLGVHEEGELDRIGKRFLDFHLEYPLRSSRFLSEVKPLINRI